MELEFSTPDQMDYFDKLRSWMESQKGRLWISIPFVDELGVSLLNSSVQAKDARLLSRRSRELGDLNQDRIKLKNHEDLHWKFLLGDEEVWIGSSNLTHSSLLNNFEVFLRLSDQEVMKGLKEAFLALWEA